VLSLSGSVRVFLAVEPCDMRKGFEGLHALVGERLGEDVRGGALFVFTNRRHTRLRRGPRLGPRLPAAGSPQGSSAVRRRSWQRALL